MVVTIVAGTFISAYKHIIFRKEHTTYEIKLTERHDLSTEERQIVKKITMPATDFTKTEKFERMQGGETTSVREISRNSFSHPSSNLTFEEEQDFKLGNALFRKIWVSSPSSTHASDGLGPLFNARSCQGCHIKDGRGHPPDYKGDTLSMLLRLSRSLHTGYDKLRWGAYTSALLPDPVYGVQLQDRAVPGMKAEGQVKVVYKTHIVKLSDNSEVVLRKPVYSIENLSYGSLHDDTVVSARVANQMIGLGLIEAIHPVDIIANADPYDENDDGISGRVSIISDSASREIGRFGWKAQNATVRSQSATAFSVDIGISTPDATSNVGDCTEYQRECILSPNGAQESMGGTEASDSVLELVTFYAMNLAVPERRNINDEDVLRGKKLFYDTGCTSCHVPKFVTRKDTTHKAQAFQLIWPYSDFLLHDMGEGLADGEDSIDIINREWRTPPLWGIGLTSHVSDHTFFLHDGRARNLTEAILWHGGEASSSQQQFRELGADDRMAIIRFLESL